LEREIIKMYAIIDIESTGGDYDEEGITEIAIFQYDGYRITDQFCSLINPKKQIQPFVKKLTGINEKMLRNAPVFFEVAKRIVEIQIETEVDPCQGLTGRELQRCLVNQIQVTEAGVVNAESSTADLSNPLQLCQGG